MRGLAATAAWLGPALVASVFVAVFAGEPHAPLLVLAAALVPCLALLRAADERQGDGAEASESDAPLRLGAAAAIASAALVCGANLAVVAGLGELSGVPRWRSIGVGVGVLVILGMVRGVRSAARACALAGILVLVLVVALVGISIHVSPPLAWARAASRPAALFAASSPWVTEGRVVARPTTLTFSESHRVVTVTPATFRVIERDGREPTVREWRLAAGAALAMRPGDQLVVPAGARLRFEADKRVPALAGVPANGGIVWADPERRTLRALVHALGIAVTFGGGVLLLVPPLRHAGVVARVGAPLAPLLLTFASACLGTYAFYLGPEAALGRAELLPLLDVADRARTAGVASLALLFVGAGHGLRERVHEAAAALPSPAPSRRGRVDGDLAWLVALALGALAALLVRDSARILAIGLGLAAASLAPRLACREAPGRTAGVAAAFVAVAAVAALGARLDGVLGVAARYPALAAVPAAWLVARAAAKGERGAARSGVTVAAAARR